MSIETRVHELIRRTLALSGLDAATRPILESWLAGDRSAGLVALARDRFRLLSAEVDRPAARAALWALLVLLVSISGDCDALPYRLDLAERELDGVSR